MKGSISNLTLIFQPNDQIYQARYLLYRRQILQENIRWKALDEIYKLYVLLHRSDLNISENFVKLFRIFRKILQNLPIEIFRKHLIEFCSEFDEMSEFRKY